MGSNFKQELINAATDKTKKVGKLVIISGMSGAGKSMVADILEKQYNYAIIDKYVTRPFRKVEIEELQRGKNIGIKPVFGQYNDGEKSEDEQEKLSFERKQAFLKLRLPVAYVNYGNYYGFSINEVNNYLEHGRNAVVIVNDIGVIKDLKKIFPGNCVSCYVHRAIPKSKDIFMEIAKQRGDTEESAEKRYQKAIKDFDRYTNNIGLYDYTIINTENGIQRLSQMMSDLSSKDFGKIRNEKKEKQGSAKIYVFTGNPGSGKDEALETIRVQGILHSIILPKHTTRSRNKDDGEEMICPEDKGYDIESCDIKYNNFGTTYGINTQELRDRLSDGISSSLVVSNLEALNELQRKFPEEIVNIYMQGLSKAEYMIKEKDRLEEPYVKRRIDEYEKADELYYSQWMSFNHIIIDNGDLADLKIQIDTIQRYYEGEEELSIGKFKSYMDKANKYIGRFAREYVKE